MLSLLSYYLSLLSDIGALGSQCNSTRIFNYQFWRATMIIEYILFSNFHRKKSTMLTLSLQVICVSWSWFSFSVLFLKLFNGSLLNSIIFEIRWSVVACFLQIKRTFPCEVNVCLLTLFMTPITCQQTPSEKVFFIK